MEWKDLTYCYLLFKNEHILYSEASNGTFPYRTKKRNSCGNKRNSEVACNQSRAHLQPKTLRPLYFLYFYCSFWNFSIWFRFLLVIVLKLCVDVQPWLLTVDNGALLKLRFFILWGNEEKHNGTHNYKAFISHVFIGISQIRFQFRIWWDIAEKWIYESFKIGNALITF